MALVAAKCTECGAAIEVDRSKEAGICPFCKTAFITEKVITNYITNNVTNIGKVNIGTLNVQQRDIVSDVYFDGVDKVLYAFDNKKGGYKLDGNYSSFVSELNSEFPNRAMTKYITAFVMLYTHSYYGYNAKNEYEKNDVKLTLPWKTRESVLKDKLAQ
jgi:hypothetical protein